MVDSNRFLFRDQPIQLDEMVSQTSRLVATAEALLPDFDAAEAASAGTVTILVATFNGEIYLNEQLLSLQRQTWPRMDLIFSDDGSRDGTVGLVTAFCCDWTKGTSEVIEGPRAGFAENFRSLITRGRVDGDYVAFCDQDDIWKPRKLEKAIEWLDAQDPSVPALYCGRTQTFPASGDNAMSPLFPLPPTFRNALVQSIAGANTMVMNRAAFELVREAARRTSFISHDWFAYLIVTGAGGTVHYSREPEVLYRQHESNLVGANNTWQARLSRLRFLFGGRFRAWTDANLAALEACRDLLDPQALACIDKFRRARRGGPVARLRHLRQSGVYRQTRRGQVGLYFAGILDLL